LKRLAHVKRTIRAPPETSHSGWEGVKRHVDQVKRKIKAVPGLQSYKVIEKKEKKVSLGW